MSEAVLDVPGEESPAEETLRSIARDCCKRHPEPEAAARSVVRYLDRNPKTREAIMGHLMFQAAIKAVYAVQYAARRDIRENLKAADVPVVKARGKVPTSLLPPRGAASILANAGVTRVTARRLFDDWVFNGMRLGDMTRQDLLVAARKCEVEAKGFKEQAEFYRCLARKVPEGQVARQAVDVDVVQAIWKRISGKETV